MTESHFLHKSDAHDLDPSEATQCRHPDRHTLSPVRGELPSLSANPVVSAQTAFYVLEDWLDDDRCVEFNMPYLRGS